MRASRKVVVLAGAVAMVGSATLDLLATTFDPLGGMLEDRA